MLFNHIYHKYDDITRIHGHQMRYENFLFLLFVFFVTSKKNQDKISFFLNFVLTNEMNSDFFLI